MVADIRGDRIRDEVAQRPSGRGARPDLGRREAHPRPIQHDDAGVRAGHEAGDRRGVDVRVAVARRHDQLWRVRARAPARARSPGRRAPRPTGSARGRPTPPPRAAPRAAPRACRRCTTAHRGRSRSCSSRTPGCRRWPPAPSPAGRRPGVTAWSGLCGGWRFGMNSTRSRPSASRAASATARWATWIGSNVPPNTPIAGRRPSPLLPRLRLPLELGRRRCARGRRPRSRPAAARCRCRSAPARAGTARPTPRRRSWSGPRSARCACRAPGTRRPPRARSRSRRPSHRSCGRRRPRARAARRARPRTGAARRRGHGARPAPPRSTRRWRWPRGPSASRAARNAGHASRAAGRSILLNATRNGFSSSAGSCRRSSSRMTSWSQDGSRDAPSTRCTRIRVRSTWRRNAWPRPAPLLAPSISPGTSAIVGRRSSSSPRSMTPRFGSSVVNG